MEKENDFLDYVISKTNTNKNWDEDYKHENGKYLCKCIYCKSTFIGHKRRVVCKECANNK